MIQPKKLKGGRKKEKKKGVAWEHPYTYTNEKGKQPCMQEPQTSTDAPGTNTHE